jgi:hypothetical protein
MKLKISTLILWLAVNAQAQNHAPAPGDIKLPTKYSAEIKPQISDVAKAMLKESSERALPSRYTELNDYVVQAPNQGEANTCLFMAATGAMEILLSKRAGLKHPKQGGDTDLSERYLIAEKESPRTKTWFEDAFLKFDSGKAILARTLPFESFGEDGAINEEVWNAPGDFETIARIQIPKVDTQFLFSEGDRFSRNVLDASDVQIVKDALYRYKSPVMTVGNDTEFWHVTVITGYDDNAVGECYELDSKVCVGKKGVFYVRDSFGRGVEPRSYEWFIRRQNSAAVAMLASSRLHTVLPPNVHSPRPSDAAAANDDATIEVTPEVTSQDATSAVEVSPTE